MDFKKSQFCKNNFENVVPFQNGGQITNFCLASIRFSPRFEKKKKKKNTFPKEILLKLGEHEYIYITEITLKKNIPF